MDNNFNNDYGFDPITGQPINKPQEQPAIQNANMMNMNLQQPMGEVNQQIEQLNVQNSNTMDMNLQQPTGEVNRQIEQLNIQNSNTMDMNSQQPMGEVNQQIEQLNVQNSNTMDMNSQQPMGEVNRQIEQLNIQNSNTVNMNSQHPMREVNQQMSQQTIELKPKQNFNKNIIVIIVLGLIAIIAGFLIYMSFSKNKLSNGDTNNNVDIENSNQDIEQDIIVDDLDNFEELVVEEYTGTKQNFVVATMGHVDHGKSTLTSAITKFYGEYKTVDEINFPSTKIKNGIIYNSALVEYETTTKHYFHYDMSGHADYVRTILSGIVKLDGAILVVSAADGPMPQTREHLLLLQQSGVSNIVVFMNKCDLVNDPELLNLVETDIRELLGEYGFDKEKTPIIKGSALKAIEGDKEGEESIRELITAMDNWLIKRKNTEKGSSNNFEARIYLLTKEESGKMRPLFDGSKLQVSILSTVEKGMLSFSPGIEMLMPGDNSKVTITLPKSMSLKKGDRICLFENGKLIGVGLIVTINQQTETSADMWQEVKTTSVVDNRPLLFAIEDVFNISNKGTVISGRVERGKIKVGDKVQIIGLDRNTITTEVLDVVMFRKEGNEAVAGDSASISLKNITKDQVERGQVLAKPKSITAATKFVADVDLLKTEDGGGTKTFIDGDNTQFYFRTTEVTGSIDLPNKIKVLKPGDKASITVTLTRSMAMEVGTEFSIRENGKTIGSGKITKIY